MFITDMLTDDLPLDKVWDSFDGMFIWHMWEPKLINANENDAFNFCTYLNDRTASWASRKDNRFGRAFVFPGFDDRPIWGWGEGHREIKITGPKFYKQSWKAAFDHPYKFNQIMIATFNDYCEGHNITPDQDRGFELAELTREYINRFKGTNLPAGEIEKIAKAYKEKPGAIKYR